MKIGILTFHYALNYGAVLQCYALQEFLKNLGHEVIVIDYKNKKIDKESKIFDFYEFFNRKRGKIRYLLGIFKRAYKRILFNTFIRKYISLSAKINDENIPQDFDAYIVGSDQVWNFGGKIDPIYFGQFMRKADSLLVAYAVSFSQKNLSLIDKNILSKCFQSFDFFSFRERSVSLSFREKCDLFSKVCCDPTFLLPVDFWNKIVNQKWTNRKYILLYQARVNKQNPNFLIQQANMLAKKVNCEVIDLSSKLCSPSDFVSLFKNAQFVLTTSFHGTAFSLIFNRKFVCYKLNDGHDDRCVELLSQINLSKRCIEIGENIDEIYSPYSVDASLVADSGKKFLYNIFRV